MNKQHLFHIGYPKAGSSLFQRHLFSQLSNIAYVGTYPTHNIVEHERNETLEHEKLINQHPLIMDFYNMLFKTEEQDFNPKKAYEWLESIENLVQHKQAVFSNEFATSTFFSYPNLQEKAERLKQAFGELRVIIIIREQRAILKSQYRDHPFDPRIIHKGKPVSLDEWISIEEKKSFNFLDSLNYDKTIRLYEDLFGQANTLVLPLELLKQNPKLFTNQLGAFIDIDPNVIEKLLSQKTENPGVSKNYNYFRRFRRMLPRGISFRKIIPKFLYKRLLSALQKGRPEDIIITENIHRNLHRRYAASNKELTKRQNLDLESLGYMVE